MKRQILILIAIVIFVITSCNQKENKHLTDEEIWKLGWRMFASSMDENYSLASLQFDTLRRSSKAIDRKYIIIGLEIKNELGRADEIAEIINFQDKKILQEICKKDFLSKYEVCKEYSIEEVGNKELQIELIRMYVEDQAARGNLMGDIIVKYKIDSTEITQNGGVFVDERNRNRLKEIFKEYGFPTKKLVGKDAMQGIFLMIQHSDRDKEWQKSQLSNIEKSVKNGDMNGQSYAYLYDRIKINSGEKQLYGTQFANVDPINKIVELADTEDLDNLDKRRMEIGMMPIQMYKEFMLKNL
ncbi:DUF6624 domain-containing protein [Neolewinella persica]|uniref:DUF6624 domain-containing protein n=1 Tax=Neolewinella persica TaxID=70998 RepID=UPI00035F9339|nr:DUF6624 domain-containing protein [Neolewinella persica]